MTAGRGGRQGAWLGAGADGRVISLRDAGCGVRARVRARRGGVGCSWSGSGLACVPLGLHLQDRNLLHEHLRRDRKLLEAIVAANPYPKAAAADPTKVHALFLSAPVEPAAAAAVDPDRAMTERLAAPANAPRLVLYLRTPNGLGKAKMTPDRITRHIGGTITQRNWRTVLALHADYASLEPYAICMFLL